MALNSVASNAYKYALGTGKIDFSADDIKVMLMRSGFTFNKDIHSFLKNIKSSMTVTSGDVSFTQSTKTIHKDSGGFLATGFVVGNYITITGTTSNNVSGTIASLTDTDIILNEDVLTDETGANPTITSNDELADGNGYTAGGTSLGTPTLTKDDNYDALIVAFPTVSWTADGGDIGPTPGAILFDDTNPDKVIIGFLDFGGDETASSGTTFTLASITIQVA